MQLDWEHIYGGYREPYDPRPAIERLRHDSLSSEAWSELWVGLHHQGDIGEASYAAVVLIVDACADQPRDWNLYALLSTIEAERHRCSNPPVPEVISEPYFTALKHARELALIDLASTDDLITVRSCLALIALESGSLKLGALLSWIDTGEIDELAEQYLSWSDLYPSDAS